MVTQCCAYVLCVGGGGFEAVWGLSVHVCEINTFGNKSACL